MIPPVKHAILLGLIFFGAGRHSQELKTPGEGIIQYFQEPSCRDTIITDKGFNDFIHSSLAERFRNTRFSYLHYAIYILPEGHDGFLTQADRLYPLSNNSFKRADRLVRGDTIILANNRKAGIRNISAGEYFGQRNDSVLLPGKFKKRINELNLFTAKGFIFAYIINNPPADKKIKKKYTSAPQIGSLKYKKLNGNFSGNYLPDTVFINRHSVFVPYKPFQKPEGAVCFFDPALGIPNEKLLSSIDDANEFKIFAEVAERFKALFPNIEIRNSFPSDSSDRCCAFIENNKKIIHISGNFIRHKSVAKECIALVIAHEIGHHEAAGKKYSYSPNNWSFCEGVADYWAASVGIKRVWPNRVDFEPKIKNGAQQFLLFLQRGLTSVVAQCPNIPIRHSEICGHEEKCCRHNNFLRGISDSGRMFCEAN